jgi:glycosyltransferase involved in cell wall biosynthesis
MIAALDATPLTVSTGGVARYTAELSRAMGRAFGDDAYWLVSDQSFDLPEGMPANVKKGDGPRTAAERRWWLWGLAQELSRRRAEVFLGTDFSVPYLPLRASVMMLHDLSPWRDPKWHAAGGRVRRRTPLLLRAGLATMVITPTEAVRKEAIDKFRLSPDRVVAIPLAASEHFRPAPPIKGRRPYFLVTGTLEPRKNIGVLVEAWHELRKVVEVDLVFAGRRRRDFPGLAEEEGLRVLGAVEEETLPSLFSNAAALLFPSFYEGFGLPALEAMQCGAPVVTSMDAALVEVTGDAALHAEASDVRAWISAMRVVLNPVRAEELRKSGLKRAEDFSWRGTAMRTREVLVEAIGRHRRER